MKLPKVLFGQIIGKHLIRTDEGVFFMVGLDSAKLGEKWWIEGTSPSPKIFVISRAVKKRF